MGHSIFSNVLIAAWSRIAVTLLGLVATALTVRIISVQEFGIYSFILTIGTFFQLIADFGLYLTASREIGSSRGTQNSIIQHIASLRIALLLGVFVIGLLGFLGIPSLRGSAVIFLLISFGLIMQSLSQLLMGVFQAYGCVWKATVGDLVGRVFQVAILQYLIINTQSKGVGDLVGVAGSFAVGLFIAFGVHYALAPHRRSLIPRVSVEAWRTIMKSSWPLAVMLVLNALYFRIDIIILSILRSEQEVGWYSLAYKIIENGLFFPAMLGGLLLPHISAAITSQNFYKAKELVSQGLTLSVYGGSIIVAVLVIFPKQLIFFIAGHNFLESAPLLQILSIALAIMFVGNIFGFALIALSEQRKLVWLYLALLIGNLVCNAIFIPLYGAIAAAWVTVATELVAMVVAARIVYMRLRWSMPVFQIGLGLAAAFVASYVGHILPSGVHIAARVCFVAVLYGGMGYVFGLWDKRTIGILRSVSSI